MNIQHDPTKKHKTANALNINVYAAANSEINAMKYPSGVRQSNGSLQQKKFSFLFLFFLSFYETWLT